MMKEWSEILLVEQIIDDLQESLDAEEASRLMLALEMISRGLKTIKIPFWMIEPSTKPVAESNDHPQPRSEVNNLVEIYHNSHSQQQESQQIISLMERNGVFAKDTEGKQQLFQLLIDNSISSIQLMMRAKDLVPQFSIKAASKGRMMIFIESQRQQLFEQIDEQKNLLRSRKSSCDSEDRFIHLFFPTASLSSGAKATRMKYLSTMVGMDIPSPRDENHSESDHIFGKVKLLFSEITQHLPESVIERSTPSSDQKEKEEISHRLSVEVYSESAKEKLYQWFKTRKEDVQIESFLSHFPFIQISFSDQKRFEKTKRQESITLSDSTKLTFKTQQSLGLIPVYMISKSSSIPVLTLKQIKQVEFLEDIKFVSYETRLKRLSVLNFASLQEASNVFGNGAKKVSFQHGRKRFSLHSRVLEIPARISSSMFARVVQNAEELNKVIQDFCGCSGFLDSKAEKVFLVLIPPPSDYITINQIVSKLSTSLRKLGVFLQEFCLVVIAVSTLKDQVLRKLKSFVVEPIEYDKENQVVSLHFKTQNEMGTAKQRLNSASIGWFEYDEFYSGVFDDFWFKNLLNFSIPQQLDLQQMPLNDREWSSTCFQQYLCSIAELPPKKKKETRELMNNCVFLNTFHVVCAGKYTLDDTQEIEIDSSKIRVKNYPDIPQISQDLLYNFQNTIIQVHFEDGLDCFEKLKKEGYNPVLLNTSNSSRFGGNFLSGKTGQQEDILRRTNYFMSNDNEIYQEGRYPLKENLYGAIYTTSLTYFRRSVDDGYAFLKEPIDLSVIAISTFAREQSFDFGVNSSCKRRKTEDIEETLSKEELIITRKKIESLILVAIENKHDSLVLSAFECHNDSHPPKSIVKVLESLIFQYGRFFRAIQFAVMNDLNEHQGNEDVVFAHFLSLEDALIDSRSKVWCSKKVCPLGPDCKDASEEHQNQHLHFPLCPFSQRNQVCIISDLIHHNNLFCHRSADSEGDGSGERPPSAHQTIRKDNGPIDCL